jgi:hypothetical protein
MPRARTAVPILARRRPVSAAAQRGAVIFVGAVQAQRGVHENVVGLRAAGSPRIFLSWGQSLKLGCDPLARLAVPAEPIAEREVTAAVVRIADGTPFFR